MVSLELFSGSEELENLVRMLENVSKGSPEEALMYLLELSEATLSLYIAFRDELPKGYGRIKFSRFVEKKRKQLENMRSVLRELYPKPKRSPGFSTSLRVETVDDYVKALESAIYLESLILKAFRHIEKTSPEKLFLGDLIAEIEGNIEELQRELERAKAVESKLLFSEFVKKLVGDRDG